MNNDIGKGLATRRREASAARAEKRHVCGKKEARRASKAFNRALRRAQKAIIRDSIHG